MKVQWDIDPSLPNSVLNDLELRNCAYKFIDDHVKIQHEIVICESKLKEYNWKNEYINARRKMDLQRRTKAESSSLQVKKSRQHVEKCRAYVDNSMIFEEQVGKLFTLDISAYDCCEYAARLI